MRRRRKGRRRRRRRRRKRKRFRKKKKAWVGKEGKREKRNVNEKTRMMYIQLNPAIPDPRVTEIRQL